MIRNPSCWDMAEDCLTKINGKAPKMKVMIKLIASGPNAESLPSDSDTSIEMNMNRALTSRASPTFLDMTLTFIRCYIQMAIPVPTGQPR